MLKSVKEMNDELLELYRRYWDGYVSCVRDACSTPAAYPFLIAAKDSYGEGERRVMVCGQETQGWGNEFDVLPEPASVEAVVGIYKGFVWSGGYSSPYWHFLRRLRHSLPGCGFVINNIVKVGRRTVKGCDNEIFWKTRQHFPVSREEFSLLKPDRIVFLTGPRYDEMMRVVLGPFKTSPVIVGCKCLDYLDFKDPQLPMAIRTYHPNYLRRSRQSDKYLEHLLR